MNANESGAGAGVNTPNAEPPKTPLQATEQTNAGPGQTEPREAVLRSLENSNRLHTARTIPYYFAAVAGLVYAVGFLVEFTFMNSMGVKDSLTEPFKAKHICIGILCLLYPASVVGLILALLRIVLTPRNNSDVEMRLKAKLYPPGGALFVVFLTAFYILVGIGRPNTFLQHETGFGVLIGLAILSPTISWGLEKSLGGKLKARQEAAKQNRMKAQQEELDKRLAGVPPEQRDSIKELFFSGRRANPSEEGNPVVGGPE